MEGCGNLGANPGCISIFWDDAFETEIGSISSRFWLAKIERTKLNQSFPQINRYPFIRTEKQEVENVRGQFNIYNNQKDGR